MSKRINRQLFEAIQNKSGLSRAATYARIQQVARTEFLPPHVAAIKVAADVGVGISRFAAAEDLAQLRHAGSPVSPPSANTASLPTVGYAGRQNAVKSKRAKTSMRKPPNQVFVVHGRDRVAKDSMFTFLRALGVKPIEWNSAIAMTKKASPYIDEILDAAFSRARAVVVLLTPDDLARLREDLLTSSDKPYERTLTGQARPNVLFEAGMAFATHPDQTVMVQLGQVREFSDVGGRHVVHMSSDFLKRQELATKLTNAGCDVDTSGSDWTTAGDFTDPLARTPSVRKKRKKRR